MKVEIVGARDYDMETDRGERIRGVTLYMLYPLEGVIGQVAEKKSVSGLKASQFDIPGTYSIDFTPKGRISDISKYDGRK